MNPDELGYMNLGSLWGTQTTPSFNNQQIPLSDGISSMAIRDANNYMALNPTAGMGGAGSSSTSGNWWDSLVNSGTKNTDGSTNPNYAGMGLGLVQGLGNLYMGMKQYGLAKDQLAAGKAQFERNYSAQRTTTNNAINDRNVARAASREGSSSPYKSLDLVA